MFPSSCLSVCVETANKPRQRKWLKSTVLQFHFMGKSYFLLRPPVSIKPLPLNYLFFFLKLEENLPSQPLLLFSSYRFITHQTGEEKWPTKLEMLSVLSAKQGKGSLPVPSLFCFLCIKLRCVEGLINDCHQSKEATAQQRMCSTNGWAA